MLYMCKIMLVWRAEAWRKTYARDCGQLVCGYWPGGNIYCNIAVQYMFLVEIVKPVPKS